MTEQLSLSRDERMLILMPILIPTYSFLILCTFVMYLDFSLKIQFN